MSKVARLGVLLGTGLNPYSNGYCYMSSQDFIFHGCDVLILILMDIAI